MQMIKVHFTLWVVLLLGGFLIGFVPEYSKNRDLRTQMENPQKTIDALRLQIRLDELRDEIGLTYVEASRQNFGLAREHASNYYNKLKDLLDETSDPALKKSLTDLAATQDAVVTSLSTASANSVTVLQPVVVRTSEATKNASVPK
jgi:hypothetical protein